MDTNRDPSIRDAATLIVIARNPQPSVLMGRRPATARFMPGVYVFPGGAVEAQDSRIPVSGSPRYPARLSMDAAMARSLPVCAIRETYEETGILIGASPVDPDRDLSIQVEEQGGLQLHDLQYLGRAITPPTMKLRFHARFFMCVVDQPIATDTDSEELEDLQWVSLPAIQLPAAPITEYMLKECWRRVNENFNPDLEPLCFRWENGERVISFE